MLKRYKGLLWLSLTFVPIICMTTDYQGRTIGDQLLRAVGIPPWTDPNGTTGLHVTVLLGTTAWITGIVLSVKHYKPRFPKILSTILISTVLLTMIFPWISEKLDLLIHMNAKGTEAVRYVKKDSNCNYLTSYEAGQLIMDCQLRLINYNREPSSVNIKPDLDRSADFIAGGTINREQLPDFEPVPITLHYWGDATISIQFRGRVKPDFPLSSGYSTDLEFKIM